MERSVSLSEAETKVYQAISDLGLYPELRNRGYTEESVTAWSCELSADGVVPIGAIGSGKGNLAEAKVGALFEALEHYLTGPAYFNADDVHLRSASELTTGALAAEASAPILRSTPSEQIACYQYTSLLSNEILSIPLYLSSPWYLTDSGRAVRHRVGDTFDYRWVARYATNCGCAIGVSENEATVHALNEIIERDAVSQLLVRTLLTQTAPPSRTDPTSLPSSLAELLFLIEDYIKQRVYLLDIKTDIDVPAYLAYVPPSTERPHLRGAGASLSPEYAAYRALCELMQCYLLKDYQSETGDPFHHLASLRKYPDLYRCGLFDLTSILPLAHTVGFPNRPTPSGPEQHLPILVERVRAAGLSAYRRNVRTLANGITAVHVVVPGTDRFMLVTNGAMVVPNERSTQAVESREKALTRP